MMNRTSISDSEAISGSSIYRDLASHQRNEAWRGRDLLTEFQNWAERYNVHFKLDIPEIALCVDVLPVSVYGHYRIGHNGFGLKGEIAINELYLTTRASWQVLGTLCHECLHAWQHAHGKPSPHDHHNLEFRRKAAELGLLIDRRGVTDYLLESPFMDLVKSHGVEVPTEAEEESASELGNRLVRRLSGQGERMKGKSTLIKWTCGCQSVRCGRSDLQARCMKCGNQFMKET